MCDLEPLQRIHALDFTPNGLHSLAAQRPALILIRGGEVCVATGVACSGSTNHVVCGEHPFPFSRREHIDITCTRGENACRGMSQVCIVEPTPLPCAYLHTRMCIYQHTSRAPRAITVFMKVNTPANL